MTDRDDEQTIKLLKHVKGAWVSHLLGGIFMSMRECVSPFFTPRLICRTVKINHLMQFMLNREYLFAPNKSMKAELLMNENGKWQMIIMRQLTNCFRLQNAQESLENIHLSSLFIVWNQIEFNKYVCISPTNLSILYIRLITPIWRSFFIFNDGCYILLFPNKMTLRKWIHYRMKYSRVRSRRTSSQWMFVYFKVTPQW